MEEQELEKVEEAKVEFRAISDRSAFTVTNEDSSQVLVEIAGYDLEVNFNLQYINSLQDVEMATDGLKELFAKIIMDKLLEHKKELENQQNI